MKRNSLRAFLFVLLLMELITAPVFAQQSQSDQNTTDQGKDGRSWEMPGRISIYDLQFGSASLKDNQWQFMGNSRTFNAGLYGDRLTLMVRFSYSGSKPEIPLKFVVKLPDSRQYEETVSLTNRKGNFSYQFTIHRPADFIGSGSVYMYYGFSIVDVLDFTIVPGT